MWTTQPQNCSIEAGRVHFHRIQAASWETFFFFFFFSNGAGQLAHHRLLVSARGRTKGARFILWIQCYANKLWEICANIFSFKIQGFVYDSLGHIYLPVPNLQCVFYYIHRRSKDYPTWSWFTGFLVIYRKRQVMTFQSFGITQGVCVCVSVCVFVWWPIQRVRQCSHCWRPARILPELAQTHNDKALHGRANVQDLSARLHYLCTA